MAELLEKALKAFQKGDFDQAAMAARALLNHNPDDPYAIHIIASIALMQNMPATTIALIGRILPVLAQDDLVILGRLYQTLGRALMMENQLEAARSAFVLAIEYFPEEASAHGGLGEVTLRQGRLSEAVNALSQAVRLAPREAVLWGLLGEAYLQKGHYQQAVSAYGQAQKICPVESSFYANQGSAYFHLAQWEAACDALKKALSLGHNQFETKLTMALVRLSLGEVYAARNIFEDLYRQVPDHPALLLAYGNFCYETGERQKAEKIFQTIESSGGEECAQRESKFLTSKAAFNRSAILLEKGLWHQGWSLYEKRKNFMPQFYETILPQWDGAAGAEAVSLKLEGGWGDSLMFLRFLPDAALRRPLRLDFPSEMKELLQFMPGLPRDRLVAEKQNVVAWQTLNSLPYLLDKKPESDPYLCVPGQIEPDLIGICWSGNAHYLYDRRRSLPVGLLESLSFIKGVRFLSLQKGNEGPDWMEKPLLVSLSDLAKSIQRCAFIISIDSLVANMAGAMGKDLWLLCRKGGDWRWSHNFWYQNVRLFCPTTNKATSWETWLPVVKGLEGAVLEWVKQGNKL